MSLRNPICLVTLLGVGALVAAACGSSEESAAPWYGGHPSAGSGGSADGGGGHAAVGGSHTGGTTSAAGSGAHGTEICDGIDNNGDGKVDEGCSCTSGASQPCYLGPLGTRHVGECKDGTQKCVTSAEFNEWGDCTGSATPANEVQDGKDNDCNGATDDVCGSGKPHVAEICGNGVDDDCDGLTDCLDSDCPACTEDCSNGKDDDGNALVDCKDPACSQSPNCKELNCEDGIDNDGDTLIDCKDPDCAP